MSMLGTFVWLVAEAGVEASEEGGFGINTDILETNLVNLLIVAGLLFYFGRGFLGKILSDRRSSIETAIREAEERKQQAAAALADEQQKLAQAQQEAARIRAAADERAATTKATILEQAERDIQRLRESVTQDVDTERARAIAELRQRITTLALQKAEAELPSRLNDDVQRSIIDRSISMLGGAS
ncbi:ATP synthase, F0 subunit b [Leptolyngbyaceae cyanobacterium JSC-12]|nr:ATP synthase, F0 subunit b [Leptolyngbyaceae cyanobacterium JSC-12]